ncbi:MAG: hypothetical protein AAF739_11300 [Pseudomonadota bacterium]
MSFPVVCSDGVAARDVVSALVCGEAGDLEALFSVVTVTDAGRVDEAPADALAPVLLALCVSPDPLISGAAEPVGDGASLEGVGSTAPPGLDGGLAAAPSEAASTSIMSGFDGARRPDRPPWRR